MRYVDGIRNMSKEKNEQDETGGQEKKKKAIPHNFVSTNTTVFSPWRVLDKELRSSASLKRRGKMLYNKSTN